MAWVAENWYWLLFIGVCLGMHFFMHGDHSSSSKPGHDTTGQKHHHS